MPVAAHNETTESSTFNYEGESTRVVLSPDSDQDGLLTLVEIARRIEQDESKHAAVLAKIKRLVAHESVRDLLGAVRAGGKGFRYPERAVEKMQYLVTNPLVSAANADEFLRTLDIAPASENAFSIRKDGSSTSDLCVIAEIVGAAIRQSGEVHCPHFCPSWNASPVSLKARP